MLRDNTESVYNLIPPAKTIDKRSSQRSPTKVYDPSTDPIAIASLKTEKPRATFGRVPGSLKPDPSSFLKKHSGEPVVVKSVPRCCSHEKVKPPIPREEPVRGQGSGKDFITDNALDVIHATPKKLPQPIRMATEKEDYGKVPEYLVKFNNILREKKAKVNDILEEKQQAVGTQPNTRRLEESEKLELIEGLKKKWQQVNEQYQKTSLAVDTWAKKARKEALEDQLIEIETDIKTLSRRVVLVVDKGRSQSSTCFSNGSRKHQPTSPW